MIETYVGTDGKPVPEIHSYTACGGYNNFMFAAEITNMTVCPVSAYLTVGVSASINTPLTYQAYLGPYVQYSSASDVYLGTAKTEAYVTQSEMHGIVNSITGVMSRLSGEITEVADDVFHVRDNVIDLCLENDKLADDINELSAAATHISSVHNFV